MKKLMALAFLAVGVSTYALGAANTGETCSKTDSRKQGDVPACLAINAVTSDTDSAVIDTFNFRYLAVKIWADEAPGGASATVQILCRPATKDNSGTLITAPWTTCALDVVNPDNTVRDDQYITLSRSYQYMIRVSSQTTGTVSAIFERQN